MDSELYWKRFYGAASCFEEESTEMLPVHILDVPAHTQSLSMRDDTTPQEFSTSQSLDEFLVGQSKEVWKHRFISMCQRNSWSKLQITKPMLKQIVRQHDIDPGFLEVPLSFFDRSTDEEQAFCVPWTFREDEDCFEVFYTFRYAEYKGHLNEPYVIRQNGVYQKFNLKTKTSLWILVSPVPGSAAHGRMVDAFLNHTTKIDQNPLWLHCLIQASYLPRWREYMASYERRLLPLADRTAAAFLGEALRVNHETLSELRSLESRFMPVFAILQSLSETLCELTSLSKWLLEHDCIHVSDRKPFVISIENYERHAKAIVRTAEFLQQRSNSTAALVCDTVTFKNQEIAQEQNRYMLLLTRSAVFLTIVTFFYLPWTFMSGLFGMNFFMMDEQTYTFVTSPKLWIYFVASVILTVCTMLLYRLLTGFPEQRPEKRSDSNGGDGRREIIQRTSTDVERFSRGSKKWP